MEAVPTGHRDLEWVIPPDGSDARCYPQNGGASGQGGANLTHEELGDQ